MTDSTTDTGVGSGPGSDPTVANGDGAITDPDATGGQTTAELGAHGGVAQAYETAPGTSPADPPSS